MSQASRQRPIAGAYAQAVDAALALGLYATTLAQVSGVDRQWRGIAVVVAAVACGVLAVRRRWPVLALALAAAAGVLAIPVSLQVSAAIAILLAAYAVGTATDRRTTLVSGLTAGGILAVGGTLLAPDSWTGPNAPVTLVAATLVGIAVGDAVRSRRELMAMLQERARHAEQSLEAEARRRVAEERLRIARDVHDLVAHHIAVVNVQAGVAAHHLRDRPDAAATALAHVRTATRGVLEEFKAMVGMLRGAGDQAGDAPAEPTPGLANLDQLLDSCAAAGLQVNRIVAGTPSPLPATVDLVAYRIVQESLTNARKHGHGGARLALTHTPESLEIEVCNHARDDGRSPDDAASAGHGLVGMRERVAAVGGTLEAGPVRPGEFVVTARLPATYDGSW